MMTFAHDTNAHDVTQGESDAPQSPQPVTLAHTESHCEPTCTQDSILRWTQANAATWARQRLTRIQESSDE